MSTLQAVQAQPEVALRFGIWQEQDIIDVLLTEADKLKSTLEWLDWVVTLARFKDERASKFFLEVLGQEDEPRVFFAAQCLAGCPLAPFSTALLPMLLQNENPVRARAVACLLAREQVRDSAARLRLALLAEETVVSIPECNQITAHRWLAELAGPFRTEALNAHRSQGQPAWVAIAQSWGQLRAVDQVWILQWGLDDR